MAIASELILEWKMLRHDWAKESIIPVYTHFLYP